MNMCKDCRYWSGKDQKYLYYCMSPEVQSRVASEVSPGTKWDFGCIFFSDKANAVSPAVPKTPLKEQEDPPGFPKTNEDEIRRFWLWFKDKHSKGVILADERPLLDNPDPIPPKFMIQRFRRQTEQ